MPCGCMLYLGGFKTSYFESGSQPEKLHLNRRLGAWGAGPKLADVWGSLILRGFLPWVLDTHSLLWGSWSLFRIFERTKYLSQKGENGRELSLKPEKNSYGEEGFYVIFGMERGWTETNRWILQEDFDLIEELNAGHRWPAVEWIASKVNELPVEGGIQVLDDSPFQLQSVWFWVVILNLFDWLTSFVCPLFLTPPSPQPTSSGSKASGSQCNISYVISPWLSCEPSFSRTLEWPIW